MNEAECLEAALRDAQQRMSQAESDPELRAIVREVGGLAAALGRVHAAQSWDYTAPADPERSVEVPVEVPQAFRRAFGGDHGAAPTTY